MVDSASEAGDDNKAGVSAKHTIGEEAEAGTWWLEVLSGTRRSWHGWLRLFQKDAA